MKILPLTKLKLMLMKATRHSQQFIYTKPLMLTLTWMMRGSKNLKMTIVTDAEEEELNSLLVGKSLEARNDHELEEIMREPRKARQAPNTDQDEQ